MAEMLTPCRCSSRIVQPAQVGIVRPELTDERDLADTTAPEQFPGECKVAKHFVLDIADRHVGFRRDVEKIAEEAHLDGFYVIRTSVPARQCRPTRISPGG
jgi:hypothetical protein